LASQKITGEIVYRMKVGHLKRIRYTLQDLTSEQLNDLLVHKTLRLLDLLAAKKTHGTEYRDIKLEVECIQRAINENRNDKNKYGC